MHDDDLVTVEEAATMTRLSPSTVRYLIHKGTFAPSGKFGRRRMFRRSELRAWIDQQFENEKQKASA
ncbi:helix-turn-helix domain-containing protein [Cellulosimicrobium funkei]|uniref:helix-turn-helix domain-containing protein n=1 Tax=Cellulosimicrobium funkei TaxID=264251 RepID=UPI00039744D4